MSLPILLISIVFLVVFGGIIYWLKQELDSLKSTKQDPTLIAWLKSMQQSIETTNKTLNDTLRGSTHDVTRQLQTNTHELNERLDKASRVIGDLQKHVGELSEVGRGIKSLQEFLQSPKLRGNIGEQVLNDMIGQTFPKNSFHLQYAFKSGMKVDAALKTDAGLLCIDSKFPMPNYLLMHEGETEEIRKTAKKEFSSEVKKHITDISRKYILPEEGTLDFALMYIPSESVYYDLANMNDLMEFARRERVYPVSPNTLYAHLQVLLLSFQGKELEQQSKEVFRLLRAMQKDYQKVEENLSVLGKHITNAYNSVGSMQTAVLTMGQKLTSSRQLKEPGEE